MKKTCCQPDKSLLDVKESLNLLKWSTACFQKEEEEEEEAGEREGEEDLSPVFSLSCQRQLFCSLAVYNKLFFFSGSSSSALLMTATRNEALTTKFSFIRSTPDDENAPDLHFPDISKVCFQFDPRCSA